MSELEYEQLLKLVKALESIATSLEGVSEWVKSQSSKTKAAKSAPKNP